MQHALRVSTRAVAVVVNAMMASSDAAYGREYTKEVGFTKKGTGKHGNAYENELILSCLVNGHVQGYPFKAITDIPESGAFDDLTFWSANGWKLIQIKHQADPKEVRKSDLTAKKRAKYHDFSLELYLDSYINVISNAQIFKDAEVELILATNRGLEPSQNRNPLDLNKILKEQIEKDPILVGGNWYKFNMKELPIIGSIFSDLTINGEKVFTDTTLDGETITIFVESDIGKKARLFFERLVLAVNQPDTLELRKMAKATIAKEFDGEDIISDIYNKLRAKVEVLQNQKEEEKSFETDEGIDSFFQDAKERHLGGISYEMADSIDTFTGRHKELEALHEKLSNGDKSLIIFQGSSITGLGAIGKSQLARKYVQKFKDDYTDWIWINADNLEESLRGLAKRLWISEKDIDGKYKSIETIIDEVYNFFGRNATRKPLFVFDNAESYPDIKAYLPRTSSAVTYLITSRNQRWGNINVFPLDVLSEADAVKFITKVLDKEPYDDVKKTSKKTRKNLAEDVKKLAERLGYLPLALQQAVACIKEEDSKLKFLGKSFTISEYLKRYEEKTKELLTYSFPEDSDDQYKKTTFTTWKITIDAIHDEPCYGVKAKELLDIISYFSPDDIDTRMLVNTEDDPDEVGGAIILLIKYSMINQGTVPTLISVHRLVQEVTRLNLKDGNNEEGALRKALNLVEKEHYRRPRMAVDSKKHLEHELSVWEYSLKYDDMINCFSSSMANFINKLNVTYRHREAEEFGKKAIKRLKMVRGEKDDHTIAAIDNLVTALDYHQNYGEADEVLKEVIHQIDDIMDFKHAVQLGIKNIADAMLLKKIIIGADVSQLSESEGRSYASYVIERVHRSYADQDNRLRPIQEQVLLSYPSASSALSIHYQLPRLLSYFFVHGRVEVIRAIINTRDEKEKRLILNEEDNSYTPLDRVNTSQNLSDDDRLNVTRYLVENGGTRTRHGGNRKVYTKILMAAARDGHIETFKHFIRQEDSTLYWIHLYQALIYNQLNIIHYLYKKHRYSTRYKGNISLRTAKNYGAKLETVQYFIDLWEEVWIEEEEEDDEGEGEEKEEEDEEEEEEDDVEEEEDDDDYGKDVEFDEDDMDVDEEDLDAQMEEEAQKDEGE